MKWKIAAAALVLSLGIAAGGADAAEKWNMALVGRMTVPQHVTFEEGEQAALPFMKSNGPRWTFIRGGMMNPTFYTMTYRDGPEFSYGWAASAALGSQYLFQAGESDYKGKTPSEQMDLIAERLNSELKAEGASFSGTAPLVRINDKKNPRWEGSFVITVKERDITYREAYQMVLQVSGFQVALGVIASDADRKDLTDALSQMMKKRNFYSDKELLKLYLKTGK